MSVDDFKVDDRVVVKVDDLMEALHLTMTCTPVFAEYCLSLILEKLSSDLKFTKSIFVLC